MFEQEKRELLAELADAEEACAQMQARADFARNAGRDRDAAKVEACAVEYETRAQTLRKQLAAAGVTPPPRGTSSSAPAASTGKPSSAAKAPATFDIGDQVIELETAHREGRAPAAWATQPIGASTRAVPTAAAPAGAGVLDQVIELEDARREGREPAAWATQPLRSTSNAGASRA